MNRRSREGFVLSALLHAGVIVLAVALTVIKPSRREKPVVFTLVGGPAGPAGFAAETSEGTADEASDLFQLPEPPPPAPTPAPPPRTPPVRRPTPPPRTTPSPPPRAKTKSPAPKPPPKEKAKPKPKPSPPPAAPSMSYEEFIKKFGRPKSNAPRPTRTPASSGPKARPLDAGVARALRSGVFNGDAIGSGAGGSATASALDNYIARLREALKRVWEKPAGVAQSLSARVEFDLAANGRLSNARIVDSSGHAGFDRSVLDSFRLLGSAGPTPDGRARTISFTFRMRED